MPQHVAVEATARLHLGFLDLNGSLGRRFGSLGLSLDQPATRLRLTKSAALSVEGPESARAKAHLESLCKNLGIPENYRLVLEEVIPAHAGLGSGTQLAMAIAAALRRLEGLPLDIVNDAELLQRGARSGAGAALFTQGGLIVDGGHGTRKGPPPVLARVAFPEHWRVLLVMDQSLKGVHGDAERAAFAALPPFSAETAADICHHVLMQALPAIVEEDITQFGAAIAHIQEKLGAYFAPAQGGRYTSPAVGTIMQRLAALGAHGMGQSSWGPTGFAFVASEAEATALAGQVGAEAEALHLKLLVCKGMNAGAKIENSTMIDIKP